MSSKEVHWRIYAKSMHKLGYNYFSSVQEQKTEDQILMRNFMDCIKFCNNMARILGLPENRDTANQFRRWDTGRESLPIHVRQKMEDEIAKEILIKGIGP